MNFLRQKRETLEKLLLGLDTALARMPLMEMERQGNPSIPVTGSLADRGYSFRRGWAAGAPRP
jgi:hypothetical protein